MGKHLQALLSFKEDTEVSRNELAQLTGMANSYLIALAKGEIKKVGRDKLISISVALNLSSDETNLLMREFSYADINDQDSELFIQAALRRKIVGMQSVYKGLNLYLFFISLEMIPGDAVMVLSRPSGLFAPTESRFNHDENSPNYIYQCLYKACFEKRKWILDQNIKDHTVTTLICRQCLSDYIDKALFKNETSYISDHFTNIFNYMNAHDNYRILLTDRCQSLMFELKYSGTTNDNNKLVFGNTGVHDLAVDTSLVAFATDLRRLFTRFHKQKELMEANLITHNGGETIEHIKALYKAKTKEDL
ncbi:MAG: hypothetical protein ABSF90_20140 [Syntrophobacteraceae bacterium]